MCLPLWLAPEAMNSMLKVAPTTAHSNNGTQRRAPVGKEANAVNVRHRVSAQVCGLRAPMQIVRRKCTRLARSFVKKISYASVSSGNTKVGHPYVGDKHYAVPHKFRVAQDKGLSANFVDNSQHVL